LEGNKRWVVGGGQKIKKFLEGRHANVKEAILPVSEAGTEKKKNISCFIPQQDGIWWESGESAPKGRISGVWRSRGLIFYPSKS